MEEQSLGDSQSWAMLPATMAGNCDAVSGLEPASSANESYAPAHAAVAPLSIPARSSGRRTARIDVSDPVFGRVKTARNFLAAIHPRRHHHLANWMIPLSLAQLEECGLPLEED